MLKNIHLVLAFIIVIPVFILSVIVGIIPAYIMRLLTCTKAADRWIKFNGILIARIIMSLVNAKMEVEGTALVPKDGTPVCFVANHQSLLDIPAVIAGLRVWAGFIAKNELRKVPILNFWIESIHCVYINRKSPRSSIEAIFKGVKNIRDGYPMFIFPEGTRSKTGALGQFKSGSLKLATRAKAVIVPIAIQGTRNAFEDKKGMKRVRIKMSVCEPIPTDQLSEDELKRLPELVFGSISERHIQLIRD
ncbi:MAG: 1-acyl-sn-glycerol-3-phosphate acyltransferase [Sphaerochaetaceae bacterium]|jgi:1-acyl-sn-glycerol-3-phosphate acyltransferase|nr:1-acyl-sn-glycerol-3-phosphate acyltransferase [Sphaerochaetaceae bacterium]MDD3669806.1 lysophospholipid acyltransferase family protein [Sphaerochaetaceae bacterium]MDD4841077.1 lysophospholipid acyltransferase family protein [Sphaerochaetaceae bacterium]MDX9933450.1 lysophospholipid acyltransferase family protein [Sphaerochaetaceae bacterium]NLO61560.1 1-acyl-sn-glycerol-3-phosphate acyltransferase [Spirochaetales bacterium]